MFVQLIKEVSAFCILLNLCNVSNYCKCFTNNCNCCNICFNCFKCNKTTYDDIQDEQDKQYEQDEQDEVKNIHNDIKEIETYKIIQEFLDILKSDNFNDYKISNIKRIEKIYSYIGGNGEGLSGIQKNFFIDVYFYGFKNLRNKNKIKEYYLNCNFKTRINLLSNKTKCFGTYYDDFKSIEISKDNIKITNYLSLMYKIEKGNKIIYIFDDGFVIYNIDNNEVCIANDEVCNELKKDNESLLEDLNVKFSNVIKKEYEDKETYTINGNWEGCMYSMSNLTKIADKSASGYYRTYEKANFIIDEDILFYKEQANNKIDFDNYKGNCYQSTDIREGRNISEVRQIKKLGDIYFVKHNLPIYNDFVTYYKAVSTTENGSLFMNYVPIYENQQYNDETKKKEENDNKCKKFEEILYSRSQKNKDKNVFYDELSLIFLKNKNEGCEIDMMQKLRDYNKNKDFNTLEPIAKLYGIEEILQDWYNKDKNSFEIDIVNAIIYLRYYSSMYYIEKCAKIPNTSELSSRNLFSSIIAEYYGIENIIPKTEYVQFTNNEQKFWGDSTKNEGFMLKKARGELRLKDIYNIIEKSGKKVLYSNEAIIDLNSLWIFDFICGQIDRHDENIMANLKDNEGNYFKYKQNEKGNDNIYDIICVDKDGDEINTENFNFKNAEISDITGIDNDISFGLLNTDFDKIYNLKNPFKKEYIIKYIDKELYENIQNISIEKALDIVIKNAEICYKELKKINKKTGSAENISEDLINKFEQCLSCLKQRFLFTKQELDKMYKNGNLLLIDNKNKNNIDNGIRNYTCGYLKNKYLIM